MITAAGGLSCASRGGDALRGLGAEELAEGEVCGDRRRVRSIMGIPLGGRVAVEEYGRSHEAGWHLPYPASIPSVCQQVSTLPGLSREK